MKIKKIAAFLSVALVISCASSSLPSQVEIPMFVVSAGVVKLLTTSDRGSISYDKDSLKFVYSNEGKKFKILENPGGHIVNGDVIIPRSSIEQFASYKKLNRSLSFTGNYCVLNDGKVFFVNAKERIEATKSESFIEIKNGREDNFPREIAKTFLLQNHKQFNSIVRSIEDTYEADVFYDTAINLLASVADISQTGNLDLFMSTAFLKLQGNLRNSEKSEHNTYVQNKPIYNINTIEMMISDLNETGKLRNNDPYSAMSNAWELLLELSTKNGLYDHKSPLAKDIFFESAYNSITLKGIGDSNYESLKIVGDRMHSDYYSKFDHVMRSPAGAFKRISGLYGLVFSLADPKKFGVKSEHIIANTEFLGGLGGLDGLDKPVTPDYDLVQDRALRDFIAVGLEMSNGMMASHEDSNLSKGSYVIQYGTPFTLRDFLIPKGISLTAKKLITNDGDEIIIGRNYSKADGEEFFRKSVFTDYFPGVKYNSFTDAGYLDARDCLVSSEKSSGTKLTEESKTTAEIYPEPKISYERTSTSVNDASLRSLLVNENCINTSFATKNTSDEAKNNSIPENTDNYYSSGRDFNLLDMESTTISREISIEIINHLIINGVIDKKGHLVEQKTDRKIYREDALNNLM